jgi:hypothetical protein
MCIGIAQNDNIADGCCAQELLLFIIGLYILETYAANTVTYRVVDLECTGSILPIAHPDSVIFAIV